MDIAPTRTAPWPLPVPPCRLGTRSSPFRRASEEIRMETATIRTAPSAAAGAALLARLGSLPVPPRF